MPERDYPIGHPASSDYDGRPYRPAFNPSVSDFPEGHPARAGKNGDPLSSPDGMRAALNERTADLHELAAIGSLPPVLDTRSNLAVDLTSDQLAYIYVVRQALRPEMQDEVTERYHLDPKDTVCVCGLPQNAHGKIVRDHQFRLPEKGEPISLVSAVDQAKAFLRGLGYTPEAAKDILDKYGIPDIMRDREHALAR